jgi:HK97 family phage prohead protease
VNEYRQLIVRSFTTTLTGERDGHQIRGCCVPYGEVTTVDDGAGPYKEMFARGAFRRAAKAPRKVFLDFEHQTTILDVVGHGLEFVERDDGLHGVFEATGTQGERALELIDDGVLTGMSVRATVLGPGRHDGDVTVRTACHLDRVALCRQPAYAGAVVEALRSADPTAEPAELARLRPARNPDLDARLRALGVAGVIPSGS